MNYEDILIELGRACLTGDDASGLDEFFFEAKALVYPCPDKEHLDELLNSLVPFAIESQDRTRKAVICHAVCRNDRVYYRIEGDEYLIAELGDEIVLILVVAAFRQYEQVCIGTALRAADNFAKACPQCANYAH